MSTSRAALSRWRKLNFLGFALSLIILFSGKLAAQTSAKQLATPYMLSDWSEATVESNTLFRQVSALYADSSGVIELEKEIKELFATNKFRVGEDSMYVDFKNITRNIPVDEILFWEAYKASLIDLREKLIKLYEPAAALLNQVNEINARWLATIAFADTLEVSEESRESLLSHVNTANQRTEELEAYLENLFVLEQKVAKERAFVENHLIAMEDVRLEMARNLFDVTQKPLVDHLKENKFKSGEVFKKSVSANFADLKLFLATNYVWVCIHIAFAVFIYFLLLFLKRIYHVNDEANADKVGPAKLIFDYPIVSALTLGLINSGWFYTAIPVMYLNILIVLSILPIGFLFPRIINRSIKNLWAFLVLVVFLDKLAQILSADESSHRLVLLISNLVTVVGFVILLYTQWSTVSKNRRPGWRLALVMMHVYSIILLVSIFANFTGAYLLSVVLNHGVIHSFTVGVLTYIGIVITLRLALVITRFSLAGRLLLLNKYSREFERGIFLFLTSSGLFIWIRSSLRNFEVIDFVLLTYRSAVTHTWQFGEISISLQNIISFSYILLVFILIANVLHIVLREEVLPRVDARRGFPLAATVLSRYFIMFLGFVLAMSAAGIELSKLNLLIGALGVGIGFGMQSVVSNFVSGLVILFERPINIGDTVTAGNVEGIVVMIGLRSSQIRTFDGAEIIVPNNNLVVNDVTNWTYSDKKRRIERIVFVDAGPNPRHVKQVIDSVIIGHPGLVDDPTGQAYFLGYENQALKYKVLMWMNDNMLSNPSEVLLNLHDALTANGYKPSMPVQRIILETDANNNAAQIIGENKDQNPTP